MKRIAIRYNITVNSYNTVLLGVVMIIKTQLGA